MGLSRFRGVGGVEKREGVSFFGGVRGGIGLGVGLLILGGRGWGGAVGLRFISISMLLGGMRIARCSGLEIRRMCPSVDRWKSQSF